ncbi:glycoside-pentoside-hexuronide (GPH):cation symporter [Bullifex sp.]|uniref:glycoside-pentoside-hexuronide (GPH):cation symporter n=1 Tax=Bullifex sp. TaxID=2815808 RepID=UPI002A7EBF15|nr:glycoside-pentoside-hexuronide (GPH):cation symporter [Bullifex sp.]MDY4067788.1 glycoside-pentoside-hexuronide (GPH):cation symporter [Bullifex sp.]
MANNKYLKKNLWFFPLGTVGRDMLYQLFTNYILLYVLFTRQLTAAQLMAITVIMVLARIFDAVNDPIMGNIIERTRTKWGKYKPWLLIGIITTSIVVYLAFSVRLQGWAFVVFFAVIYFLYSITYTMHDIAYWGMVPSLGSDGHSRDQFTSRATLFAGIGATIAGILIPMFTTGSMTIGGNAQVAYSTVALAFSILGPIFLLFTIVGVKEDRSYMTEKAPKVSLNKIITTIKNNDQLIWVSIIFLIQQIGLNLILGGIGSTYIYFTFGYEGGLYSTFSTIGVLATAFLMVFYPAISQKINRKTLMKYMLIMSLTFYTILLISGLFLPNTMLKFWIVTISYMFTNLGQYSYYLIMMISIINTVEYNEYKNGNRDEAIIASLRPFLTKFSSAIVVMLTSLSYLMFGITNITNQISSFEQQTNLGFISEAEKLSSIKSVLSGVNRFQSAGLLFVMCLLPAVLMALSYFLYKKHYILDEVEYERIVKELERGKV